MKKGIYIGLILMTCLINSVPLMANVKEQLSALQKDEQVLFIDASLLNLPYIQIPGFLVSPLQVSGELLAPFSQERVGYIHRGIDIRAAEGTPVYAIADGIVTKAAPDSKGVENGGGHMIFVDFGEGAEGRYMHLSAYGVTAGDRVKAGQVIGFTGNTGDSSTPHLHFEYLVNGVAMDPAFIFEASGMIETQNLDISTYLVGDKPINNKEIAQNIWDSKPFFIIQK